MEENRTLSAVPGIQVGHAEDRHAETGCTVVLGPFSAAVEVRGLATGSRELDALSPLHLVPKCDAILLTGGSAFGLAAADGVVRWLEERGRGFETRAATVPIVPAAVIYDLGLGDAARRPDAEMGYAAAAAASSRPVEEGPVGVGAGASVGKLRLEGLERAGVGTWADPGRPERPGAHAVAALAVVNAFGDVLDDHGRIIAGSRGPDGGYLDTARAIRRGEAPAWIGRPGECTTLAVVATDAPLDKTALQVVARQAMNAVVRRVSPASTAFDGDIVFAAATGATGTGQAAFGPVDVLALGLRAQHALEQALQRAVRR
ncbi:MAG: P1 family peptidase [Gemmatimonadota bacterium]|jgi:L-aminopeptidase/D-esterase-like protein|nr:MAG: P1 family peptidase [Gemmatimonadota bacterium]